MRRTRAGAVPDGTTPGDGLGVVQARDGPPGEGGSPRLVGWGINACTWLPVGTCGARQGKGDAEGFGGKTAGGHAGCSGRVAQDDGEGGLRTARSGVAVACRRLDTETLGGAGAAECDAGEDGLGGFGTNIRAATGDTLAPIGELLGGDKLLEIG